MAAAASSQSLHNAPRHCIEGEMQTLIECQHCLYYIVYVVNYQLLFYSTAKHRSNCTKITLGKQDRFQNATRVSTIKMVAKIIQKKLREGQSNQVEIKVTNWLTASCSTCDKVTSYFVSCQLNFPPKSSCNSCNFECKLSPIVKKVKEGVQTHVQKIILLMQQL